MTLSDVFAISASIIVAIGGAGAIIFGLSSWLGNILANIFIDKHKSKLEQELESFKSYLAREKDREIEQLKSELNLISLKFQTEHSNLFSQRVDIIRYIYDGLIDIR